LIKIASHKKKGVYYKDAPAAGKVGFFRARGMVTLLHTNCSLEFFLFAAVKVLSGKDNESPVLFDLVRLYYTSSSWVRRGVSLLSFAILIGLSDYLGRVHGIDKHDFYMYINYAIWGCTCNDYEYQEYMYGETTNL